MSDLLPAHAPGGTGISVRALGVRGTRLVEHLPLSVQATNGPSRTGGAAHPVDDLVMFPEQAGKPPADDSMVVVSCLEGLKHFEFDAYAAIQGRNTRRWRRWLWHRYRRGLG